MGSASKLMKNRLVFWEKSTIEMIKMLDKSKNIERMVEASASIILLASVKRDTISPVRRVAKKDIGR